MKGRRTRAADGIHDDGALRSVGAEVGGLNFDLLRHVGIDGGDGPAGAAGIDNAGAVEQVGSATTIWCAVGAQADADGRARGGGIVEVEAGAVAHSVGGGGDAGKDLEQLGDVAALNGEALDVLGGEQGGAFAGVDGRNLADGGFDGDLFGAGANGERESEVARVAGVNDDAFLLKLFESLGAGIDGVGAGLDAGEVEEAGAVAVEFAAVVAAFFGEDDVDVGDDGSGAVEHGASETGRSLRMKRERKEQSGEHEHHQGQSDWIF
jgi:hypothetical protein